MFRSKNGDVTGICDSCGTFGEELNLEDLGCIYPLVNKQFAIENGHRKSGFSHETW